jgi:hypothetical protein
MTKLSYWTGHAWREHSFPAVFKLEKSRISGGIPNGDAALFERLVTCLSEPVDVLYVLHTPRGEADPGRYQSPPLTMSEFRAFVDKFREFLRHDGRFDIWAHSRTDNGTIAWDRHNNFYAYGAVEKFATELRAMGYNEGNLESLGAHEHHYREEFDHLARSLMSEFEWSWSPLRTEDEQ